MTLMGWAEVIKNCGLDCGKRMRNSCSLEKMRYLQRRKKIIGGKRGRKKKRKCDSIGKRKKKYRKE